MFAAAGSNHREHLGPFYPHPEDSTPTPIIQAANIACHKRSGIGRFALPILRDRQGRILSRNLIRCTGWGKLLTSGNSLAYTFDVVAWEGWNNRRHAGAPAIPQRAHGLKVLLGNPDDEQDTHQFWAFTRQRFQSWAGWYVYINGLMSRHGLDLADPGEDAEAWTP